MDFKGKTTSKKKKIDDDEITKEPKGDEHIVGLYLRQRVENL